MLNRIYLTFKQRDILLLFPLLLINPLFYAFNSTAGGMMPDSPVYILFGNQLIQQGNLFIEGWGHVDNGLVLPPLYPMLIGLLNLFNDNGIYNAQLISTLALLLATVPLYTLVRRLSAPMVAVTSVIIFQLNFHTLFFGTTALAEGVFILILLTLLDLNHRFLRKKTYSAQQVIIIGIFSALLFFSRQIGIFYLIIFPLLLLPQMLKNPVIAWRKILFFISGFLLLFAPYSTLLYIQSGQGPFTQHFRMHHYVIETATIDNTPSIDSKEYLTLYKQRREQRRLLPDSTEMIGSLLNNTQPNKNSIHLSPQKFIKNLQHNFKHTINSLGLGISLLFALTSLSALYASVKYTVRGRLLLPVTITTYIFTLSLVVGLIERYISILYPLLTIQILTEVYFLSKAYLPSTSLQRLSTPLVALIILALTPQLFTKGKLSPRFGETHTPISHCKPLINSGDAIFSITTMEAYILGGNYRVLPNDELHKISRYAHYTGVKWLFLRQSSLHSSEAEYYNHSHWLQAPQSPASLNSHYKLRCRSRYGDAQLYEIITNKDR